MGESHEERKLDQIIESIQSGNVRQRDEAVTDLKAAFNRFPRSNVDVLTDKSYHKIYEVLFKTALNEKKAVLTAKKATKTAATKRLTDCGDAIRVVVKAGASKLKSKTVDAVADHILQVLPTGDGGYDELLADSYFKALNALFESPVNAERLKSEVWLEIVDFCLRGINDFLGDPEDEPSGLPHTFSGLGTGQSSGSIARTSSRGQSRPNARINQNLSDLFQTILQLVSAPNAPLFERYEMIADSTMLLLTSHGSSVGQVHQTAFSILNTILRFTRMDRTLFSRAVAYKTIPVVSRIWQGKSLAKDEMLNNVRDEMFIFMFSIFLHLEREVRDGKNEEILSNLEELLDALRTDYSARSERDQLQLDDLELLGQDKTLYPSPFHLDFFQLRPYNSKAERNWALLLIIGILERLVSLGQDLKRTAMNDDLNTDDVHPIKRQRTTQVLDRLLSPLRAINEKSRTAGLQIIPFVLQECQLSASELAGLIGQLHQCAGDKRGNVGSWALIAMSSCNYQNAAKELDPCEWMQLWHIGVRSLTFSTTCRAASLQLHTLLAKERVKYHDIGEDVNSIITAADTNGPAVLCESSILFVIHLLHAKVTETPGSSLAISQHVIRWLFARWDPVDRAFAMRFAMHAQPIHIANLVRTCLGLPLLALDKISTMPSGPVAQAWQQHLHTQEVISYLLLLDDPPPTTVPLCSSCPPESKGDHVAFTSNTTHFISMRKLLLELLQPKCNEILQSWSEYHGSTPVMADIIRSVIYGSIGMLMLIGNLANTPLPQIQSLESDILALTEDVVKCFREAQNRDRRAAVSLTETLLQCVWPYLPTCRLGNFSKLSESNPLLLQFFVTIADEIESTSNQNEQPSSGTMDDLMDIDDHFTSTPTKSGSDSQHTLVPRDQLSFNMWPGSFYRTIIGHLKLISARTAAPDLQGHVPSVFVDYLVALEPDEFLAGTQMLKDVLSSELVLDLEDASKIIAALGDVVSLDLYARAEVSWVMCLDALVSIGPLWSSPDGSLVADLADQMYLHIITKVLDKGIASPAVQKSIAELLFFLMRVNEEYGCKHNIPSPRSILFTILQNSNVSVKFYIGKRLPEIFKLFLLSNHESVFLDILNHLPKDSERIEEIYFRQYVFATLASSWPTLLRRCIYNIFEGAGKIPECIKHSTKCLEDISSALGLGSPQELFTLFAPQILYTWLVEENIKDIPFVIFGFPTLRDLVREAQDEATAIMAMRGQEDSIKELASLLDVNESSLLQDGFGRIIAYNTAYTISTPPPIGEKHMPVESGLKRQLGSERFFECLSVCFTDIIAILFITLDPEKNIEKYFSKHESQRYAAQIIIDMKEFGSPRTPLPQSQQPAFKARFLCKEIEHICTRTRYEQANLFTPTLVTYIARLLFNTIHPALGSLHACSVLQKIRVLISLAGPSGVNGYPLEMLIQSVAPFLADPECTDDAIGILQYLIQAGSRHLLEAPSFVAGFALAISGSLASLLDPAKASSQYVAVRTKARDFHSWLGQYLTDYTSPALKTYLKSGFRKLVLAAFSASSSGSSESNTSESVLLVQLLKDERVGGELLSRPSRELALGRLSSTFRSPQTFRSDALGTDELSIEYATLVWKSCRSGQASRQYLSWAARVTGRAFAASGLIHEGVLQESTLAEIKTIGPSKDGNIDSESAILCLLRDFTLGLDSRTAGLAEDALRLVLSMADEELLRSCGDHIPNFLFNASIWDPFQMPPSASGHLTQDAVPLKNALAYDAIYQQDWTRSILLSLAQSMPNEVLLNAIVPILQQVAGFPDRVFPFIIHLVLSAESNEAVIRRKDLSAAFGRWFSDCVAINHNNLKMLLNSILYLRTQVRPNERSSADRAHWLDIDYLKAGTAAAHCGMFKTALLFIEESCSQPIKSSRRSSTLKDSPPTPDLPTETLLTIFENIDDPDLYYGVQQTSNLKTILARFEYEKDGPKALAFRGAQYDSHIRRHDAESNQDAQSLVKALDVLNLSGLSHSLLQSQHTLGMTETSAASMFQTARKLERWDIPVPSTYNNSAVTMYRAFQGIHTAVDEASVLHALNEGLEHSMAKLATENLSARSLHETMQTMAALVEMDEVFTSRGSEQFEHVFKRFQNREQWMRTGRFDDISHILSCRGTTLSTLSQDPRLQTIVGVAAIDTRLVEVNGALMASKIYRSHDGLQEALSLATSMTDLIHPCNQVAIKAEVAIHMEAANALWDQGEMGSSIRMLQALDDVKLLKSQTISVGRSHLLSTLGHRVSIARLEKADQIIEKYLAPALAELKGTSHGSEAGQVFHQFAVFCDEQLQDPDGLEDLARLEKLSKNKEEEVQYYDRLINEARSSQDKAKYKQNQDKSKKWLKMDLEELQRHIKNREQFLQRCLENYLLALAASDDHNSNALRFSSLWFEHSGESLANEAVSKHMRQVPSRKFAPLMNQLSSRLQKSSDKFQQLLFDLVLRICTEHPYHSMYHVYAGVHTKANLSDQSAVSRKEAANKIVRSLEHVTGTKDIWQAILVSNKYYCQLAAEKKEEYRASKKFPIDKSQAARNLVAVFAKYRVPPPTMSIDLSPEADYSAVPIMIRLEPQLSIASGVSAPKIITAVGSNGTRYKQLVKGGNDDLRQDAIMEQVFEQVSELLKANKSTRQRNLHIRTYRVLPLTPTAGVIEFVANTIPLHDYLLPAHEKYYPKDWKGSQCRKEISEVQTKSTDTRMKVFRNVTEHFHPVMRYFFTEKFQSPDEWFAKRLAYTRSTAAISILGHVVGLGDRHGHNILLDAQNGEVVHIDLGIAFEMGRVLPIPENVPFRLTRDIVDGMGITKTEGVFRRCCEFTLEALRKEVYSIMTILDVLRYDPLYSWSISPVRIAKLQEGVGVAATADGDNTPKERVNEPGEAERALAVVSKKLSKTLSVTATVNDLINQAGDEKNLATLFSGWAAYV
ncbi:phosphatidylinositol 3 [Mollisia scopiformis]|uniref:Serine/threonine-protein kinase Tel1 n=1 Tax=Mollisia scopiformis TaxID=149040 RepID=A0A132BDJ9_MOLSC|nr:phosphatidylinositol 3 [Mollisia scopiformis]KUJ09924.1 phosphatidylinositol 3 [Mollisia scopiformis]